MQKSKKANAMPAGRRAATMNTNGAGKRIRRNAATSQATPAVSKPSIRSGSKLDAVVVMLRRPKGVSIEDLCKGTGWQVHSVRGAISGTLKKKLDLSITSEKNGGVRVYRVTN